MSASTEVTRTGTGTDIRVTDRQDDTICERARVFDTDSSPLTWVEVEGGVPRQREETTFTDSSTRIGKWWGYCKTHTEQHPISAESVAALPTAGSNPVVQPPSHTGSYAS